jgi:nicotinamide-nucleotide amidase
MLATIITIGDEILIGQIVDTNSAWMAQELNKIGISIYEILSVSDQREHILSAFAKAKQQSQVVLITGGLGPTKDDITKKTMCAFFNDTLVLNEEVLAHVTDLFATYIKVPMAPMNREQALVPSRAQVLKNTYGTAPATWIEDDGVIFISMPGVPFEMKEIMRGDVFPRLKQLGNLPFIHHRTILTAGQGESTIATRIEQWENDLPEDIKLAYLPSFGTVRLRLSCTGHDKKSILARVDAQIKELYLLMPDIIVGESETDSIVQTVCKMLQDHGLTVATAESCTGGRIANAVTEIPGASKIFKGSTITYATASKVAVLGIDASFIEKHSVVSAQVAQAMAAQVRIKFDADIAISTTGNAGPEKGDSDAAVGTVFIGVATKNGEFAHEFMMGSHRERVIEKTVNKAFELIQQEILKKASK